MMTPGKTPHGKQELMEDAMRQLAERYDLFLEFVDDIVYVTTVAGEWRFNYMVRPITLYHRNKHNGARSGNTQQYHKQALSFPAPMDALAYIWKHEVAASRRQFSEDVAIL